MIELGVMRSPDREEVTRIMFFRGRGYKQSQFGRKTKRGKIKSSLVSIDTSTSSILPHALSRAPETAQVILDKKEPLKLRVFIDRSIVEVFVNGKQCLGVRVYPGLEESVGVSLRSQGRNSTLTSLDAWQMKSIYK